MIIFEFPLNERIRRLLRIEEIYQKFEHQLKNTHDYFEFGCFNTLFEIVQLVSRSDLKIDFVLRWYTVFLILHIQVLRTEVLL